jgi:hypothetical protein
MKWINLLIVLILFGCQQQEKQLSNDEIALDKKNS